MSSSSDSLASTSAAVSSTSSSRPRSDSVSALPGSRYCGLEAHQALEKVDSDEVAALGDGGAS